MATKKDTAGDATHPVPATPVTSVSFRVDDVMELVAATRELCEVAQKRTGSTEPSLVRALAALAKFA